MVFIFKLMESRAIAFDGMGLQLPSCLQIACMLTKDFLHSKISNTEYVTHVSAGKIIRWCVLTLENGYVVSGDFSVCLDPADDDPVVGEKVAFDNAFERLWVLEGYLAQELGLHSASDD